MIAATNDSPLTLDATRCTQCRICIRECPIARFAGYTAITQVTVNACLGCGHCVAVCPHDALAHAGLPADAFRPAPAPPAVDTVLDWCAARRSVRHYAGRPVPRAAWETLLAAVGSAPSGLNARPVRATVVTDPAKLAAISVHTIALFAGLLKLLKTGPGRLLLRLLLGKSAFTGLLSARGEIEGIMQPHDGDPILHGAPGALLLHASRASLTGHDDCLLAAMQAMLVAPSLGLATCLIGFALPAFQRDRTLRALLALPPDAVVHAVLIAGYPATPYHRIPPRPAVPVSWQ